MIEGVFGKKADLKVVLKFGLPAFVTSFIGASLLIYFSDSAPLTSYMIGDHIFQVTLVKIVIAVVMLTFVILDYLPFSIEFSISD